MLGLVGEVRVPTDRRGGQVLVHGELWSAISDEKLKKGDRARVVGVEGLVLKVEKIKDE
jgi:membrane-bound serine protease (ClpP class)